MKKNNGFTLIELLATIIILAGIALVAFPILLNTIKNSENKIDSATRRIIESAAKLYVDNNLNDYPKNDGNTYCIPFSKLIEEKHLEKGILDAASVDSDNKVVKVTVTDDYGYEITNSDDCTVEFIKICRPVTAEELTIGNIPTGNYAYGDEYICDPGDGEERHFFVLEHNININTISLIMDRNIGDPVPWSEDGKNDVGAVTATTYLKEQTGEWDVQVNLPTYSQIYNVNKDEMLTLSIWMYDYLKHTTNLDSILYGYWTSTTYEVAISDSAWAVNFQGSLTPVAAGTKTNYGVRPVITISKDEL